MFSIITKTNQVVYVPFEMSTFNLIMGVSICLSESLSPRTIAPFPAEEVVMPSPHTQNEVMVPVCPIHYNMYCPAFPATAWSNHFWTVNIAVTVSLSFQSKHDRSTADTLIPLSISFSISLFFHPYLLAQLDNGIRQIITHGILVWIQVCPQMSALQVTIIILKWQE